MTPRQYIDLFLRGESDFAAGAGVQIVRKDTGLAIIGIAKLKRAEFGGDHNIYMDILDAQGIATRGGVIHWTWNGRRFWERADPVVLDKVMSEAGGNIGVHAGQIVHCWPAVGGDEAKELSTAPLTGEDRFHTSYYIAWGPRSLLVPTPPPVIIPPIDPPSPGQDDAKARLRQIYEISKGYFEPELGE